MSETRPVGLDASAYDTVLSVEALGEQIYYDLHVPIYHNYLAEGLIHHNSAKTYVACLKALWLCDEFPGNRGVIARKVARELRATTMATFRKVCPPSAYAKGSWNLQEGTLQLNNGSEIIWLHLEDQEHIDIVRGLEINFFLVDQAEEIDEGTFDLLMARLGRWDQVRVREDTIAQFTADTGKPWPWWSKTGKALPPVYPMLTCNPDTELHWIYRRFHPDSPAWRTKWQQRRYKMIFFSTLENKFLSEQNKQALLANDAAFVRRYVEGVWGIPEGTIHVVPPESLITITDPLQAQAFLDHLRATCRLHRALDHGDAAPTCCVWFAVDRADNIFVYREYYQPDKLISYHREQITALSQGETYESGYADPSIFHKAQQKYGGRWCTADEYADRVHADARTAIQWWPGDNNEMGTRNRINEYLRVDPERVHPWTKQKGAPRLFFVTQTPAYPQGVANVLTETRGQKRVSLGTIEGESRWTDERDPGVPDHGYDPLRYFMASRPPVSPAVATRVGRRTFLGQQALIRAMRRRGGGGRPGWARGTGR